MNNEKWYQKNWFVILTLIIFFPIGLFLMWYFKKWNKSARWIVTGVFTLLLIISFFTEDESQSENQEKNTAANNEKSEERAKPKKESKPKEEKKKELTDEQKLEKNVKKEVGKKNFSDIVYNEYDNVAIITLKDYSGFSEKSALREMQYGAANALMGVKKSKLDIDNVDIVVAMDMEDNKMNTSKDNVLKMTFDKDLIENMNDDNKYKLRENAERYASEYWVHPAFR
ncbi:VanZ family protein [Staphylococcus aureus]